MGPQRSRLLALGEDMDRIILLGSRECHIEFHHLGREGGAEKKCGRSQSETRDSEPMTRRNASSRLREVSTAISETSGVSDYSTVPLGANP